MELPNVTFVVIDRVAHELTKMAIEDSLNLCNPADLLIFTDKPDKIKIQGACYILTDPGDMESYNKILYAQVPKMVHTSHFLTIEWDGWIVNPGAWSDKFLEFDYIGAPWPFHKSGNRVGNGGFSLRSARLTKFLMENSKEFPPIHAEDHWLCREYGSALMAKGFKWADEDTAQRFSFENGKPHPEGSFGFHDCRNWRHILSEDKVQERLKLENDYLKSKLTWIYTKQGHRLTHLE